MLNRWRTLFHSTHSPYVYTRWVFLRLLGVIYLIAFGSLNSQITGLIGQNGLLPASRFLDLVAQKAL